MKKTKTERWQDDFRNSSLRTTFSLNLSRPMLEYLCATADNVTWDRGIYRNSLTPNNWLATETALQRRGLCVRKSREEIDKESSRLDRTDGGIASLAFYEMSCCKLTPAGQQVVELLKLAGIFVEQDVATAKKKRKAT